MSQMLSSVSLLLALALNVNAADITFSSKLDCGPQRPVLACKAVIPQGGDEKKLAQQYKELLFCSKAPNEEGFFLVFLNNRGKVGILNQVELKSTSIGNLVYDQYYVIDAGVALTVPVATPQFSVFVQKTIDDPKQEYLAFQQRCQIL